MAVQLSNVNSTLLPPTVTQPIFDQAIESSSVMSLARKVPLAITANTVIPVSMDIPAAGWVSEAGAKPVGAAAIGIKQMSGKKVALLVPVSEEVATSNAGGLFDQLKQDLPIAIARAFDYAAIHGLDLRTGGAGPFTDYLVKNASSVELGTTSQANGGMYADLVNGEAAVTNAGYDFTGFAADPRLKPTLKLRTDTQGRPLFVDGVNGQIASTLIGYPAFYNRGVSGKYRRSGSRVQVVTITGSPAGGTFTLSYGGATTAPIAYNAAAGTVQTAVRALGGSLSGATVSGAGPYTITIGVAGSSAAPFTANGAGLTGGTSPTVVVAQSPDLDSKLRAVGGDWTQAAYGVGMDIRIKVSTEASYVDLDGSTVSAFQNNLVLLLVEAYFGFVTSDALGAFVAYNDAV
jgi:hypothetical protein